MRFGSVCSGIEAASLAWNPLGWQAAWFSEIEPFPSELLRQRFPDVPNLGDMRMIPDRIRAGEVEAPDLLCGGTPCQAFSYAGKRRSLEDERGNLSLTFCEIADEIDAVRTFQRKRPAIVFWENVPGVLTVKDNAFGCFLGRLIGADFPLSSGAKGFPCAGIASGPKRNAAWRVLDAQYFGVPQRRRRIYVVASAADGGGIDPAKVLFERQSLLGNPAPGSRKGKEAPCFPEGSFGTYRSGLPLATLKARGGMCGDGSESLVLDDEGLRHDPRK